MFTPQGRGPTALTQRERVVIDLLARRATTAEIAAFLRVSPSTVKNDISSIRWKLKAYDRHEIVLIARDAGLVSESSVPSPQPLPEMPQGWLHLTPRERQIAVLLTQPEVAAMGQKQIGYMLGLSPDTIRKYMVRIYRKLGVSSRGEAMLIALRAKAITDSYIYKSDPHFMAMQIDNEAPQNNGAQLSLWSRLAKKILSIFAVIKVPYSAKQEAANV